MQGFKSGLAGGFGGPSTFTAASLPKGMAFQGIVFETFQSLFGESPTETIVRTLGSQALSEPDLLAKGLSLIFRGGARLVLEEIEKACVAGVN
jgi:hypothetical protein